MSKITLKTEVENDEEKYYIFETFKIGGLTITIKEKDPTNEYRTTISRSRARLKTFVNETIGGARYEVLKYLENYFKPFKQDGGLNHEEEH